MIKTVKTSVFFFLMLMFCLYGVFFASASVYGDVDGDGVLAASDARTALRISVGLDPCSEEQILCCDFDYDDAVTASDARELLRISVGLSRSDDSGANGMDDAEFVGMTDKFYKIYNKDGITYIDGILIANKTYSLPFDYAPGGLLEDCETAFYELQNAAMEDGQELYLNSGYRSYVSQQEIYDSYVYSYGFAYAEAYAARPGHSEHQTGLAIDVTNYSGYFTGSPQAKWLAENCVDFGFILRYPEGKSDKTGYNAEAWHIRYVGNRIAEKINKSGLCLEEYYGITSIYQ